MLTYFIDNTTSFTVRTEETSSGQLTLELEDMYTLTTQSLDLTGLYTYTPYESILEFTASLTSSEGSEYHAKIIDSGSTIWRGTIQVLKDQPINKKEYRTQRNEYSSSISTNEYIIL